MFCSPELRKEFGAIWRTCWRFKHCKIFSRMSILDLLSITSSLIEYGVCVVLLTNTDSIIN